ncbi:Hypothetical predicted protein [Olea europaea subsp. europaea]|uniref:Uncharacterized protein n=1 Tax=Olea europaea subsp. europaea TaxID=158383 RepID=A0A8S0U5G2_OLEEU|nr:Hypothetical predicted protein [Olea europaea subsp. europaea]
MAMGKGTVTDVDDGYRRYWTNRDVGLPVWVIGSCRQLQQLQKSSLLGMMTEVGGRCWGHFPMMVVTLVVRE